MRSYVWLLPASNSDDRQRKWRHRPTHLQITQPILDRVQLNHQKLSKRLTCRGRKIKKNLRCSLTWFCRLCAKNSLPVFIFVSTTTWNEKREKKTKKHKFLNLRHVSVPASISSGLQESPSIPCNTVQWYVMMENTVLLTFVNICLELLCCANVTSTEQ